MHDCKTTDAVEIRAFFGLLWYTVRAMWMSYANLEDLCVADAVDVSIFPTTMSLKRTKFS